MFEFVNEILSPFFLATGFWNWILIPSLFIIAFMLYIFTLPICFYPIFFSIFSLLSYIYIRWCITNIFANHLHKLRMSTKILGDLKFELFHHLAHLMDSKISLALHPLFFVFYYLQSLLYFCQLLALRTKLLLTVGNLFHQLMIFIMHDFDLINQCFHFLFFLFDDLQVLHLFLLELLNRQFVAIF